MELKSLTQDELESMGYDEIAYLILLESGKKQTLLNLFQKVCKLLKTDFESHAENVPEFFELLSTNKKFIMLDNGFWDLQINHKTNIVIEHEDEDHVDIEEEAIEHEEEHDNDIFYEGEATDDTTEDDLADFALINEDDEEETGI